MSEPITKDNFQARGKAYIAAHDNEGFLIAQKPGRRQGVYYEATPQQWWAWRNYRIKLGLPTRVMDQFGAEGHPWTVPCEWPGDLEDTP